jgi:hypothetical protein
VGESRWKSNAEAWYRIGQAQEAAGDAGAARESWTRAAEEPRPVVDALSYYRAMALRRLARNAEADSAFEELLKTALCNMEQKRGDPAENQYLAGLALKGKGDRSGAALRFAEAVKANHGHRRARWESDGFTGE